MKKLLLIVFVFIYSIGFCQQESSWQIWIVPTAYTINLGDTLKVTFGITGYGSIDPLNLKIVSYSDETTLIVKYGEDKGQYFNYWTAPLIICPKDKFTKKIKNYPDNIVLESDLYTVFQKLLLLPTTSGDKKLLMIATYSPDGENWYTSSREFSYHVNSFTEQYQTIFVILSLILAFFGFQAISWIFKYFENRLKSEKVKALNEHSQKPQPHKK